MTEPRRKATFPTTGISTKPRFGRGQRDTDREDPHRGQTTDNFLTARQAATDTGLRTATPSLSIREDLTTKLLSVRFPTTAPEASPTHRHRPPHKTVGYDLEAREASMATPTTPARLPGVSHPLQTGNGHEDREQGNPKHTSLQGPTTRQRSQKNYLGTLTPSATDTVTPNVRTLHSLSTSTFFTCSHATAAHGLVTYARLRTTKPSNRCSRT